MRLVPWAERSQVQFPVRAHTQVAGLTPGWGAYKKATKSCFFYISVSLSLFPLALKSMKKGLRVRTKKKKEYTEVGKSMFTVVRIKQCYSGNIYLLIY